jgi:putative endonuclease
MSYTKTGAGRDGETRAAAFLEKAGMNIIARNVRSQYGEIDLIAQDGTTIVFVEVKTWSVYSVDDLQYSINEKKQYRIIETAKQFLVSRPEYNDRAVRFDVVFIGPSATTHLVSAFTEWLS